MNTVTIIGNLTRDPELRALPSGASVCTLGVAVNERYKSGDQWLERANFFDVDVFGTTAENCAKYLSRGRQVGVTGSLRYESWEKDGQKRSKVKIVARTVDFIGSREQGGTPHPDPSAAQAEAAYEDQQMSDFQRQAASSLGAVVEDDDIPW